MAAEKHQCNYTDCFFTYDEEDHMFVHVSTRHWEHLTTSKSQPRADLLDEAKELITGDRNTQYGPPTQDFARTAAMTSAQGFRFDADDGQGPQPLKAHHVAMFMIQLKQSRLVHSPEKKDNWTDTAGYSGCGWECVCGSDGV